MAHAEGVLVSVGPGREARAQVAPGLLDRGPLQAVAAGSRRVEAAVEAGEPGRVVLSRALAQRLLLPLPVHGYGYPLRARVEGEVLRLGPLIGVVTYRRRKAPPFGADTPLIASMARLAAGQGALLYAFTHRGVDPRRRCVRGYLFDPANGRWRVCWLPLPDAVYDRVSSRSAAASPRARRVRRFLVRVLGDRYFNRSFWDKWQVHRRLAARPAWRSLLPATEPYRGPRQLLRWLASHRELWLKPCQGTGGLGILVVRRLPGGVAVQRARGDPSVHHARGVAELGRLVAALKRPGPYLVQEAIPLAQHAGRPFDIRVLAQKDGQGEWRRTKVFARVAPPGGLISNISAGGTGMRVARALARAPASLRRAWPRIRAELRRIARELPAELERLMAEPIAEVGLDLAIDREGRIRFIEANAKPYRWARTLTGSPALVTLSLLRPLQYAVLVAGFGGEARTGLRGSPAPCTREATA